MSLADTIREYARRHYVEPARIRGQQVIRIVAGDVHKALGLRSRVPAVCQALESRTFLKNNGLILQRREGPPSGRGTRAVYVYSSGGNGRTTEGADDPLRRMSGLAQDLFPNPGGFEAYIRRLRDHFYEPDEGKE